VILTEEELLRLQPKSNPQVLYQDDRMLVLFKPARMYVHPPESKFAKQRLVGMTCLDWIKKNLGLRAAPIHRLDFATEGLVIFGLELEMTKALNIMVRERSVQKTYHAVVRGWFRAENGSIDRPLELDSTGELVPCLTHYKTRSKIELPHSVNSQFPTSRYSFLELDLITGRWHQIRRHMNREAHPVIGDREHGDSHHNRFFRDQFSIDGLCLKAQTLSFLNPISKEPHHFDSPLTEEWEKLEGLFGLKKT